MARAPYTKVDDAALLVWQALIDAGAAGLDMDGLEAETGLKRPQIRKGIRRLKEVLQVPNKQPIACSIPGYRYVLTEDWPEERDYITTRLKDLMTRLVGIEPTIEAAALKWGRRGTRRTLARQVVRIREDVSDLLDAADAEA
jgi:hypothetical protein